MVDRKLPSRRTKPLDEPGEWGRLNFEPTSPFYEQGRLQPMFTMTKDGYAFLVGKMTGKKAAKKHPKTSNVRAAKPDKT